MNLVTSGPQLGVNVGPKQGLAPRPIKKPVYTRTNLLGQTNKRIKQSDAQANVQSCCRQFEATYTKSITKPMAVKKCGQITHR